MPVAVWITEIVRRRFGVGHALAWMDLLLHRIGWSMQVLGQRAAERNETAIAAWRRRPGRRKRTVADLGDWIVFDDESGQV